MLIVALLLMGASLAGCTPPKKETKFEEKIDALCRAEGYQKGTQEFETCFAETSEQELEAVRAAYQRLLRGEGID